MSNRCRVTVSEGVLCGETSLTRAGREYYRFLGVPYARPPLGSLRFQNPKPPEKWNGERDAIREGNVAPQIDDLTKEFIGDEDCLYLNIATPVFPEYSPDPLPVFIYIHGGGFINGNGSFNECGPDYIIEKDCIFVSMNYRLNVLGFLCLETDDCPGNMGLVDQHMALQWIKNNISAFGGDPDNVSLIGISAGAASVECHVVSPMTPQNLFHKTMIHSGSATNFWVVEQNHLDLAHKLAKKLDKSTNDPNELYEVFKNASAKDLVGAAAKMLTDTDVKRYCSFGCFKPIVWKGNKFLNKTPIELLRSGSFLKVPTIMGFCSEEYLFLENLYNQIMEYKEKSYHELIPLQIDVERDLYRTRLRDIYGLIDNNSRTAQRSGDFISDLTMLGGIFAAADLKLKHDCSVYFYRFSYDGNMNYSKQLRGIEERGTCHADDQTYIGTNHDVSEDLASPNDVTVRKKIIHMWTDFAKCGNPTPRLCEEVSTKWLTTRKEEFIFMDINEDLILNRGLSEYMRRRRELWIDLYAHYSS